MTESSDQASNAIENVPSYPTHEALRTAAQPVRPSTSARRLLWTLNGPLHSAISVLPFEIPTHSVNVPREPLYDPATETWHAIAQEPVSTPKVSWMTVGVYRLEEWGPTWCDMHEGHADPPELEDGEWDGTDGWDVVKRDGRVGNGEVAEWRVVKVADPAMARFVGEDAEFRIVEFEDGETDVELPRCCGQARPGGEEYHILVAAAREEEGGQRFVTIRDLVEVVHPWIMGLRTELLAAKAVTLWEREPLPDDTELMVELTWFERLGIETR